MRHICMLLTGVVMVLLWPVVSRAYTVTVNVDDPTRVQLIRYGNPIEGIQAGDNSIEYASEISLTIKAAEDAILSEVQSSSMYDNTGKWVSEYEISGGSRLNGRTYTVTSAIADEVRTDSFILNIDDASKAYCLLGGSNYQVPLKDGSNTVYFIPDVENWLTIGSMTEVPLISVSLNGSNVSPSFGSYYVNVKNGDNVNIQTMANEDVTSSLNIVYSEGAEGVITSAMLNGEYTELTSVITGRPGDKIILTFDRSGYDIESLQINNEPPVTLRADNYSIWLTESDQTLTVTATKKQVTTITLCLTDPDHVTVYRGSRFDFNDISGLLPGDNVIELTDVKPRIDIVAKTNYILKSVTLNGDEKMEDGNLWSFSVGDGDTVVVKSEAGIPVGVESIIAGEETDSAVYNLTGARVGTKSGLKSLPKGIYISGGKKIVVR